MGKITKPGTPLPPSLSASLGKVSDSIFHLVADILEIAKLEGKRACFALTVMFAFVICAVLLLITGWFALLGSAIAVLVAHDVLSLAWALLIVAGLNFAIAAGFVMLAIRRRKDIAFTATRRQLTFKNQVGVTND